MYFEEKIINGILHWRNTPAGVFVPYTLGQLTAKYAELKWGVSHD